jgi:peroxiredoxin
VRQLDVVEEQYKLLTRLGAKVIALSPDPEAGARKTMSDGKYSFPIGFGVSESDIAAIGAIPGERKGELIMQPAEFVLKPGGEISASLYATTQLGRMDPRAVAFYLKSRV